MDRGRTANRKTVSVVGASGLVGRRLLAAFRVRGPDRFVASGTCRRSPPGEGLTRLDVTDAEALRAHLAEGFDLVVVAAGTKDVARCEADPGYARALNATPVETMAGIVERDGLPTRLVYVSTDYVFDGARGGYRDDEPVAPTTMYGRSKAEGERAALASGAHMVIRSGAVMGRGGRFFDWLLTALPGDEPVRLYEDSWFSPTPAQLLCDVVVELLGGHDAPPRVVHVVGDRRLSRLELGGRIAALAPGSRASLVGVRRPPGDPLLPRDLSLVPSEPVARLAQRPFDHYLAAEVAGVTG